MAKDVRSQPWYFDLANQMEGKDADYNTYATFTAATNDIHTMSGHNFNSGSGPVRVASSGTLPTGLSASTDYWVEIIDGDTFYLHTAAQTAQDADSSGRVDITGTGSGTHTMSMKNIFNHPIYIQRVKLDTGDGGNLLIEEDGGRDIIKADNTPANDTLEWPIGAFVDSFKITTLPANATVTVWHGPSVTL